MLHRRRFGTKASEREHLAAWLKDHGVQEIVMESTAQYWKPIWLDLEPHFGKLHLAQAHSNRAPKGRKNDFGDAERLTRKLVAGELILSLVPDAEQRDWRTLTRGKVQLVRDVVRLGNQLEAFLEELRIKLSSVISELLGLKRTAHFAGARRRRGATRSSWPDWGIAGSSAARKNWPMRSRGNFNPSTGRC